MFSGVVSSNGKGRLSSGVIVPVQRNLETRTIPRCIVGPAGFPADALAPGCISMVAGRQGEEVGLRDCGKCKCTQQKRAQSGRHGSSVVCCQTCASLCTFSCSYGVSECDDVRARASLSPTATINRQDVARACRSSTQPPRPGELFTTILSPGQTELSLSCSLT